MHVGNKRHVARCLESLLKILVLVWTQGLVVVDKWICVNYYPVDCCNPWSGDQYKVLFENNNLPSTNPIPCFGLDVISLCLMVTAIKIDIQKFYNHHKHPQLPKLPFVSIVVDVVVINAPHP